ncbi:hypothetical protein G4H71_14080 [Rhodococcus triatomae]|uniref:Uncharacterized protein n=1 Tax=Rhodococcus triatomae TaxID=300028 RepID=A0A1G8PE10_9NOCA|nr:hypothetical protein [Rhodococcus triatomae]QNG20079.1 hypothetical protein G4H72_16295 [Rhodococcus triatomae]QNG24005.1 hypothetical protein G4H71_14080 [Rhodococcus triatomae]SDI90729.1 hypothetical protein SAMN05444695_1131 [Rhodococcus triatomae]
MSGPNEMEVGDLNAVASPLHQAAQGFANLSSQAPEAPDAGPSTARVGDALVAIANSMSQLVDTVTSLADAVETSGEDYFEAENLNRLELEKIGDDLPPGGR